MKFRMEVICVHEDDAEDRCAVIDLERHELAMETLGQRTLSIAPRHFLDDDGLATAAIDAPHGVQQKNQESPERNELETALGELIVTGRRLMAA